MNYLDELLLELLELLLFPLEVPLLGLLVRVAGS